MRVTLFRYLRSLLISCLVLPVVGALCPVLAEPEYKVDSKATADLKLPICEWCDSSTRSVGNVVVIPGLVFAASSYDSFARHLATKGFHVYGMELRGAGRWRSESETFGGDALPHYGQSRDDLLKLLRYLRTSFPDQSTYLVGESFGANTALWTMSTQPDLVDGAIVSSPSFRQCVHPKLQWPIDLCKMLWHPGKPYSIKHYVSPYISENKALRKQCAEDPEVITKFSAVQLIKAAITSRESWKNVGAIPPTMPILVLAGKKDAIVQCSVIPRIVKQFGTQRASLHILPKRGHLILEHQTVDSAITQIVDDWLVKQTEPALVADTVPSVNDRVSSSSAIRKTMGDFLKRSRHSQTYSACITAIRELPLQMFQRTKAITPPSSPEPKSL
ncbi:MAG: lysophospholipase [Candidatus Obscuribacterales bacterium]|nr:lysophospholipase [Candidatus Obscuribacterales bacterium]